MPEIPRYKGDSGPPVTVEFEATDVTNFIRLDLLINKNGTITTINGIVTDGPNGEFEFPLDTTVLGDAGVFPARILTESPSNQIVTFPTKDPPLFLTVKDRGV